MNRNLRSAASLLAAALLATTLGGCDQTSRVARNAVQLYDNGDYAGAAARLKPEADKEAEKRSENYVLTNVRYGSSALAAGQFAEAEHAFFEAHKVIVSTDTNDPGRQMQAAVIYEGVKVWKGEPYERAMAEYYMGLLFLMQHDYGNARAAFQGSVFAVPANDSKDEKDDKANYKPVESPFALGYFGLGFTNLRLNRADLAQQNFDLALKYDPRLAPLIAEVKRPGVNALIFVDAGRGPRKAGRGWYNEESAFGPTPDEAGPIVAPVALLDGRPITRPQVAYDTVDTLAMAQDKKWMDIDTIKKVKAVIGTGAMAAGAGMTAYGANKHDEKLMWAGVGTMLLGAAISASSQSDTRYWEMLPRTVYIIPATLPPGQHEVSVQAGGSGSAPVVMTANPATAGGDYVFYFRLR